MTYYERKEKEHIEMVECWWYAIKVMFVIAGLIKICGG